MSLHFDHPQMLWLLALAIPVVLLGHGKLAALEIIRRWTAITLRLLVLLLLVLMLAGMQTVRTHTDLTVVAVVDRSESIRRLATPPTQIGNTISATTRPTTQSNTAAQAANPGNTIEAWINQYLLKSAMLHQVDDRMGLVTYDARPTVRSMPSTIISLESGTRDQPLEGTDSAAAIRLAMAMFPPDSARRLVLVTDGNDTATPGDLLVAAREAKAAGVPIDVLPIDYKIDHEVMVEGVYSPAEAHEGQVVVVRTVLRATHPTMGVLHLLRDGVPLETIPQGVHILKSDWVEQSSDLSGRYMAVLSNQVRLEQGGPVRFVAVFEPVAGSDTITSNNRGESFTLVHGKGRVLLATSVPNGHGKELGIALKSRGIEVDEVPGYSLPTELAGLHRYDAVVLQDVPAEQVTPSQQEMLASYVSDLGGGFMMVGGENSFGAGGWTNTPIDRILPVECSLQSLKIIPAGALMIVLDHSGSMSEPLPNSDVSKQTAANRAAMLAVNSLYPQDYCGVLAFDDANYWIVPLKQNTDPKTTQDRIRVIEPGGGTSIAPALDAAGDAMLNLNAPEITIKHIILLTDGYSEGGDYEAILRKLHRGHITLSTIGVGGQVDTNLLAGLAAKGGGAYYAVSDAKHLPQVFIKEARTIRKNLLKETEYTPTFRSTGSPIMTHPPEQLYHILRGLVLTGNKGGGSKPDPRVFMPLVGPDDAPLFAHWQVGLGQTAAFTSDATTRWADRWVAWKGYPDFWARNVRAISRAASSKELELQTAMQKNLLHLKLDTGYGSSRNNATSTTAPANPKAMLVQGSVLQPDGTTRQVTLRQTAPGTYEADVPASDPGSYIVSIFANDGQSATRAVFGGLTRAPGPELRSMTSNRAVLQSVAEITGGRVLDPLKVDENTLFRREGSVESRSMRPLWRVLLMVLLVVLLLDIASRRIAWDLFAIITFIKHWFASFGQSIQNRETQAVATLGKLKRRAAEVDERLAQSQIHTPPPIPKRNVPTRTTAIELEPVRSPSGETESRGTPNQESSTGTTAALLRRAKKFDAQRTDDLADLTMPGPTAPPASGDSTRKTLNSPGKTSNPSGGESDTTGRLLDAKKRARQKLDDAT